MSVINMKIRVATDLTLRFHHSNETTLIMQSHIKKFTLSPVSPLTKKIGRTQRTFTTPHPPHHIHILFLPSKNYFFFYPRVFQHTENEF